MRWSLRQKEGDARMGNRLAWLVVLGLAIFMTILGCGNAENSGAPSTTPSPTVGSDANAPPVPPDASTTPKGPHGKAAHAGGSANMPSTRMVE